MRNAITVLCIVAAALFFFGLVLVYTASSALKGGAAPFLSKQLIAAAAGLAMGAFCAMVDYSFWRRRFVLFTVSAIAIAASALVFLWDPVNGSRRWIAIGGFSLQPSEFSRIAMLMALSAWYGGIGLRSREFIRGALIPAIIAGAFMLPVAASPDVGATMVMCVGTGAILLAAGVKRRWLAIGAIVLAAAVAFLVATSDNKRARIMVYVDRLRGVETTSAASAAAYHVEQSMEAFGQGGMWGRGMGRSIQKYSFLPEANSDFIFAIAAEEFGFLATSLMVLAYMAILWCGIYIAYHAHDRFGAFLALGLTVTLAFEAAFNVGMVTGCLPTKGIALPFASAGGSSLMASMVIIGLLISIGSVSANADAATTMRDAQLEY